MEQMFKMMDEMVDNMCGKDRMEMMKHFMDRCFDAMSAEEKEEVLKGTCSKEQQTGSKDVGQEQDAWAMMPNMLMSMMSMMCMNMMSGMNKPEPAAAGKPAGGMGPMGGMGGMGGGMGGGPMEMMKRMMSRFSDGPGNSPAGSCNADRTQEEGSG